MPSDRKIDARRAPGRGRELDSMRAEYSELLAAWILPSKIRTGDMRYIGWMDVLVCVLFIAQTKYSGRCKKQSHGNRRTTNRNGKLRSDQHRAACKPHSTLYSNQESRSLHISTLSVRSGLLTLPLLLAGNE